MVSDIDGICEPELGRRVEEDVADSLDDGRLLALPHVHNLEQAPVALAQVKDVAKDFVDKVLELVGGDDGRVGRAQRADEDGLDDVEILQVLLLLADQLVDDARRLL